MVEEVYVDLHVLNVGLLLFISLDTLFVMLHRKEMAEGKWWKSAFSYSMMENKIIAGMAC